MYSKLENKYIYPTELEFSYDNTQEYRGCIRRLFHMNIITQKPEINEDEPLDEETLDELDYDEDASMLAMDFIYSKTADNVLFRELYTIAATRMFSTDLETGMTILFSYDYLLLFHKCLVCFFKTPVEFTKSCQSFTELYNLVK